MKVLVVGKGGREHAIVWKISQSRLVKKIYAAPGNAGIAKLAECIDIDQENIRELAHFAQRNSIDLTVVGSEFPLAQGIVDIFMERGLPIFGPTKQATQIESSKAFAKEFMRSNSIPTASWCCFDNFESALEFVATHSFPLVIKVDGLTGGKSTTIVYDLEEAKSIIAHIMIEKAWGEAGKRIIIEEFLEGEEATFMAFTDGSTILPLLPVKDYKRLMDEDLGPNTGGMGSVAPHTRIPQNGMKEVQEKIFSPAIDGLKKGGLLYKGILYAGVIFTKKGVKVLEFNSRFGDPEAQVSLPLLKNDLIELMLNTIEGTLDEVELEWDPGCTVGVVMASEGYPKRYKKGLPISGCENVENLENVYLFHSGTSMRGGQLVTDGGRVLTIVAKGPNFEEAVNTAYFAVDRITFEHAIWRTDIGQEFLKGIKEYEANPTE